MIIKLSGTKKKGRFAFRFLVAYAIRQAGVAAIRLGGGLDPKQTREQWIAELEARALEAGCDHAAIHAIASLTHDEVKIIGGRRVIEMLAGEVGKKLGVDGNQRIAASHLDTDHLHLHEIYSRVRPDLTIVEAHKNERYLVRSLARELEIRLGLRSTRQNASSRSPAADDLEAWSRLPSFNRWAENAGADLRTIDEPERLRSALEKLGIWIESDDRGHVLATMHDGAIVRAKASVAGLHLTSETRMPAAADIASYTASAYQKAVDAAKNRLFIEEPTYRRFVAERADWNRTGIGRGRLIRQALRNERAKFDTATKDDAPDVGGLEARVLRLATRAARGAMLDRHAKARAEIAESRPSSQYGAWLKHHERSGDVAAVFVRNRSRDLRRPTEQTARAAPDPIAANRSILDDGNAAGNRFERFVHAQIEALDHRSFLTLERDEALERMRTAASEFQNASDRDAIDRAIGEIARLPQATLAIEADRNASSRQVVLALLEFVREKERRERAAAAELAVSAAAARSDDDTTVPLDRIDDALRNAAAGSLKAAAASGRERSATAAEPNGKQSPERSEWQQRLDLVDAEERRRSAAIGALPNERERPYRESAEALRSLAKRARINVEEHQKAIRNGTLGSAPEPAYRDHGSRFEYDRLQREIATLHVVPATAFADGSRTVVFAGSAILPTFFDRGNEYQFTPLTGVHRDSMRIALLAAKRRWGSALIEGNDAFAEAALNAAAELGVRVSNPELQAEWQRRRNEWERTTADYARDYEAISSALEAGPQRAVFEAFGRTAETLSADDLRASATRIDAPVKLRGTALSGASEIAVFETAAGKLQALLIDDGMRADPVIAAALALPAWSAEITVSTGGDRALEMCERGPEAGLATDRRRIGAVIAKTQLVIDELFANGAALTKSADRGTQREERVAGRPRAGTFDDGREARTL